MKRLMDIIFSLLMIVILSPLLLIVSLIIKATSKGPVLFVQKRIGKDNVEFNLYKFRSMRVDAPNVATHLLKDPNAYITPIGRFLRKSSIDELPQLFNIIKGEMTFVGPRPALYNQYDLNEMRTKVGVHKLIPGVTGWAQVNGRDELSLEEKVNFDKQYADNMSAIMDMKIIAMTFFKVLKTEGVVEGAKNTSKVEIENGKTLQR